MKIKKRILSIILSVVIVTTFTMVDYQKVKAMDPLTGIITITGAVVTAYGMAQIHERAYQEYHDGVWSDIQEWCKRNWGPVGFIVSMNTEAEFFDRVLYPALIKRGILSEGETADETSYNKLKTFVDQHYQINQDNSISYDIDIKNVLVDMADNYAQYMGYYVGHSYDLIDQSAYFVDGRYYQDVRRFVSTYQMEYRCFYTYSALYNRPTMYLVNNTQENAALYATEDTVTGGIYTVLYNTQTWEVYKPDKVFYYDTQGVWQEFDFDRTFDANERIILNKLVEQFYPNINQVNGTRLKFVSNNYDAQLRVFTDFNRLKEFGLGLQPYYINKSINDSYNDLSSDYTYSVNNSNKITYGDVNGYITNYYDDNGEYPNTNDVNIYITNNIPPSSEPDNPSGGGGSGVTNTTVSTNGVNVVINNNPTAQNTNNNSFTDNSVTNNTTNNHFDFSGLGLSGNTVSGNGAGDSSGKNIWSWLGDLGRSLGDLISSLGEAISNIVKGLSDLIKSLITDLPTAFFDFLGAIFDWMPQEWLTMMEFSLACMLIFGLIKIFRG